MLLICTVMLVGAGQQLHSSISFQQSELCNSIGMHLPSKLCQSQECNGSRLQKAYRVCIWAPAPAMTGVADVLDKAKTPQAYSGA